MDGCKVIVHDSEYDEYDQECEVRVFKDITPHPLFEYDQRGNCLNGEFQVFTK